MASATESDMPEQLEIQPLKRRLDFAARQAARAWHKPNKTITKKTGTRGDKAIDETSVRTAPPNVQGLEVITQTTRQLLRLHTAQARSKTSAGSASPGVSNPTLDPGHATLDSAAECRQMAENLVTELLDNTAASNKVRSVGRETERPFVENLFKFLLGERHRGMATNIIAADAEHGRLRRCENAYPGRDAMLIPNSGPASSPQPQTGSVPGSALDRTNRWLLPQLPLIQRPTSNPRLRKPLLERLRPPATNRQKTTHDKAFLSITRYQKLKMTLPTAQK
jgi:hypothetical protein